jgi:hypothetical protein
MKNGYCRTIGCTNGIGKARAFYGHLVCKSCGESNAKEARLSWCVGIPYSKGAYQLITDRNDLRSTHACVEITNPKEQRGM